MPQGAGAQKRYDRDSENAVKFAAQGMTHRQIAERLGRKPEQIKTMLKHAERSKP